MGHTWSLALCPAPERPLSALHSRIPAAANIMSTWTGTSERTELVEAGRARGACAAVVAGADVGIAASSTNMGQTDCHAAAGRPAARGVHGIRCPSVKRDAQCPSPPPTAVQCNPFKESGISVSYHARGRPILSFCGHFCSRYRPRRAGPRASPLRSIYCKCLVVQCTHDVLRCIMTISRHFTILCFFGGEFYGRKMDLPLAPNPNQD